MAISYNTGASAASSSSSNPVAFGLSITSAVGVLIVCIANSSTTGRTGGAPYWKTTDETLTQIGTNQTGGTEFNVELWYRLKPSAASPGTLYIPNTGSLTLYYLTSAYDSTGCTLFDDTQTSNTTANPSLTINDVPAGGMCCAILVDGYKSAPTGRSHTAINEIDQGAFSTNHQYGLIASLSNVTMSWTVAADNWAMIMAAFKEGGGTTLKSIDGTFTSTGVRRVLAKTTKDGGWTSVGKALKKTLKNPLVGGLLSTGTAVPQLIREAVQKALTAGLALAATIAQWRYRTRVPFGTSGHTYRIQNDRCLERTASGVLYAVVQNFTDTQYEVWKYSGGSWSNVGGFIDSPTTQAFCSAAIDSSGYIHVAYFSATTILNYCKFNTADDTWGTPEEAWNAGSGNTFQPYSIGIALDSNGVPHIATTKYESLYYVVYYLNKVGGSWNTPVKVSSAGSYHATSPDIAIDTTNAAGHRFDIPQIIYQHSSNYVNAALGNDNNATSFTIVRPATNSVTAANLPSLCIDSNGATNIFGFRTISPYLQCFYLAGTGDWATAAAWTAESNITGITTGSQLSAGIEGTTRYLFQFCVSSKIYFTKSINYGAWTAPIPIAPIINATGYIVALWAYLNKQSYDIYGVDLIYLDGASANDNLYWSNFSPIRLAIAASMAFARQIVRKPATALAAALSSTGGIAKTTLTALAAGLASAGVVATEYIAGLLQQALDAGMAFAGATIQGTGKALAAAMTPVGVLGGGVATALSASLSPAATATIRALKSLTAAILTPGSPDYYWPYTATKPQHLWPFAQTGDYTDQGSTGGVDAEAAGSGNSFDENGLVLNGSGWAICDYNADINNLGSAWSILAEFTFSGSAYFAGVSVYGGHGYLISSGGGELYFEASGATPSSRSWWGPTASGDQLVLTYSDGILTPYKNGVAFGTPASMAGITEETAEGLSIGAITNSGVNKMTGTIKWFAILKGEAWSAADVEEIYAGASGGSAGTIIKKTLHLLTGTVSGIGGLLKNGFIAMTAGINYTGTMTAKTLKTLVAGLSSAGSVATEFLAGLIQQALDAGMAFAGMISRKTAKPLIASLASTGLVVGKTLKILAAGMASTGSLVKGSMFYRAMVAGISSTGFLAKKTATSLIASLASAGTAIARAMKFLSAGLASVGATATQFISGLIEQALAASMAFAGAVSKRTGTGFVAALTFTGKFINRLSKVLAAALASTGTVVKKTAHAFAASLAFTGILGALKAVMVALAATVNFTGTVGRKTVSALVGALSFAGRILRVSLKFLSAGIAFDGILATLKAVMLALAGAISFTGSLAGRAGKSISGALTASGEIIRGIGFHLAGVLGTIGQTIGQKLGAFTQALSAGMIFAGATIMTTSTRLAGALSHAGGLIKLIATSLTATIESSAAVAIGRRFAVYLSGKLWKQN